MLTRPNTHIYYKGKSIPIRRMKPHGGCGYKGPLVDSHYTPIHRLIIVQEHRHAHIVAKSYSSPSLSFPKPANFAIALHCIVQKENICLPLNHDVSIEM